MIIDFHTHTFPDRIASKAIEKLSKTSHTVPFSDGTCAGLFSRMEKSGIGLSVVLPVATSPHQVERINDSAAELNRKWGGSPGIFSFGGMHPDYGNWKDELRRIRDLGLKGIKIHPVYQDTDLDDDRFLRIMDRCAELGLIVAAHAGLDIGYPPDIVRCSPAMSARVLDRIPGLTLVLAHMGGWRNWDEAMSLLPGTSAYLDTAFSTGRFHPLDDGRWSEEETTLLGREEFLQMVKVFGPERILFGTDSPWSDQEETLSFIENAGLPEESRDMILGGNAARLLGMQTRAAGSGRQRVL